MTRVVACVLILAFVAACASYYRANGNFNRAFEQGRLEDALKVLDREGKGSDYRTRFLFLANQGLLLSMLGRYEESNECLEKAYLFGEDYRVDYIAEAASYLYNPKLTVYRGEDHEHLLVLYYKALNYLKMGKKEEALVECRRMDIRLGQLSDRYTSDKKFRRDAFVHTLMGIIYESDGDYNNAFIAYRNAVEIYREDYGPMFELQAPLQLKKDLLDAAWLTGFREEFEFYRQEFGMQDYEVEIPEGQLVFFWHNGLGPVKDEWSINFVVTRPSDDRVVFSNNLMGLDFSFPVDHEDDKDDLSKLQVFRVAFPKYVERPTYYRNAMLQIDTEQYPLQLAEDVNQIAFYCLRERMVQEFGKGLLRVAIKKATEMSIREEHEGLGAMIGVVNALTESADTRNWQTLPHDIYYSRVPLQAGDNELTFTIESVGGVMQTHHFVYHADQGETLFHTFTSLEKLPGPYGYY